MYCHYLNTLKNNFQKLKGFSSKYEDLFDRIESSVIEMDDVFREIDDLQETLEANPNRLEAVNSKLLQINNLLQKHMANDVSELIAIKNELEEKVSVTENLDATIQQKNNEIESKTRTT